MKTKSTFILLIFTTVCFVSNIAAQSPWIISGIDSVLTTYQGYNIYPRDTPRKVLIENCHFIQPGSSGYIIQSGDDSFNASSFHNLDSAVIIGNYLAFTGEEGKGSVHGMIAGYNINYSIAYNFLDGPFYGIVHEGGYQNGSPMKNSYGGISYNVFRNCPVATIIWGYDSSRFYNNTVYNDLPTTYWMMQVGKSNGTNSPAYSKNADIRNNIFYTKSNPNMLAVSAECDTGIVIDYNIYYCSECPNNEPQFNYKGVVYNWNEWRALGFDSHSQILDPQFRSATILIPSEGLYHGTNLGVDFENGISSNAEWIVGSPPGTANQGETWQVGAFVIARSGIRPRLVKATVENETPNIIELTFDRMLNENLPDKNSFAVEINSNNVDVDSIAIAGTKVYLGIGNEIVYGDVVKISYTKPDINPLQSTDGGIANSFSGVVITNNRLINTIVIKASEAHTVFPNPTHGPFSIELPVSQNPSRIEIIISSYRGEIVYKKGFEEVLRTFAINIPAIQPGIYFISIIYENDMTYEKLLVL